MMKRAHQGNWIPTKRATTCWFRANIGGQLTCSRGSTSAQVTREMGTTRCCPPDSTRVSRELGRRRPSIVDGRERPTLHKQCVVPNPQHLLLTLFFETSLHEEKCPL